MKRKAIRNSDKGKLFYELYACYHVVILNLPFLLFFRKIESPDFMTINNKVGLEVVRSKPEEWKKTDACILKYFNKGLSAEEIKRRVEEDCKYGFKGEIYDLNGVAAYSPERTAFNTKKLSTRVIQIIEDKTVLIKTYKKCKDYWLYIFTETSLIDRFEIGTINEAYQKETNEWHYKRIYILAPPHIFILRKGKNPRTRRFSDKMSHTLLYVSKKKSGFE